MLHLAIELERVLTFDSYHYFQEVDRFDDLAEELKLKGYSGIWKVG